jgi:small subunit ribosomal protein S18
LNKFLTERGKIIPRRVTNVSVKKQRALTDAIKMARHLALISPIAKEMNSN